MKSSQRNASLVMLSVLSVFVFIAPSVTTAFAWNACGLTLTPSTQTTTIPAGTTATFTFLLTYSDSSAYATSFTLSASSSNVAWTVASVLPSPVPGSGKSDSISQTISVKVTAPATPGSTTLIRIAAVDTKDTSTAAGCRGYVSLTAGAFPPPPNGVPQFPFGIALLLALAIPALLVVKSKYSVVVKQ
jgi:hypothetical protein